MSSLADQPLVRCRQCTTEIEHNGSLQRAANGLVMFATTIYEVILDLFALCLCMQCSLQQVLQAFTSSAVCGKSSIVDVKSLKLMNAVEAR